MIDQKRKAFRDEDYNDDPNYNPTSDKIGYDVGQKFDDAGLPNPYIEDHDQVDQDNDDRDGRGLPANFAVMTIETGKNKLTEPTDSTESVSQ